MIPFAILRVLHILSGALWVGGVVLNATYVLPSVIATGPAGGQVMRVMVQVRRLPVFMNTVAAVSLLSGLGLYSMDSTGFSLAWIGTGTGLVFTFGALLAIVTAGLGHMIAVPTARRMAQLAGAIAGGPPGPEQVAEMKALQLRMLGTARLVAALLIVAMIAMVVARFV